MAKIYRTTDNNYVALVAHDNDLQDGDSYFFGAFEYSISQDVDSGEWDLHIFDLAEEESLDVGTLYGIDNEVVSDLVMASRGEVEFEEIMESDYYDRSERYLEILGDEVLMKAVAAEYAERD